ncbi:VanW family protein [Dyadobacter pollutisoli]|uniref:VanW family protein n=1 Tax=Dyadobacter pollutisoli TaxID=2910158 RepID=A0A9E8NB69_9BACT|nr:VanW family protein [Dyadobacter pollutisoli]WAC11109.1 VanW family protein [Dyadobacter pollutisoli]
MRRCIQNSLADIRTFSDTQQLKSQPVLSVSETELWNIDDNETEWILTAGKIENLRQAVKRLNGVEVQARRIFSFWKHLGYPSARRGYVLGREIREGCIVPTVAGGICQLSNALYDAALKANFEIVERHRHTKVIKGSLAERDRDATVKWNYIDLRFKSDYPFRIEVELTRDKLIVKFRGERKHTLITESNSKNTFPASKLNDCYSCGNSECIKYTGLPQLKFQKSNAAFILDEKWSEFNDYVNTISREEDLFILPHPKSYIRTSRFSWTIENPKTVKSFWILTLQRALWTRFSFNGSRNIFSLMLKFDKRIARSVAKKIPLTVTHLIVSQNLLPFLWEQGVFGGRTFDVLMIRQPLENLHLRLDQAYKNFPESKTLNDFRASQALVDFENEALTSARSIITPHEEIAKIFINKSVKLQWNLPKKATNSDVKGSKILFPASALARKGAYEIRRLAKELNFSIVLVGKALEDENFFNGIETEFAGKNPFDNVKLVIYPAYIMHNPKPLLEALARDIPVITTTASGLSPSKNLIMVPIGDYQTLKHAVICELTKGAH